MAFVSYSFIYSLNIYCVVSKFINPPKGTGDLIMSKNGKDNLQDSYNDGDYWRGGDYMNNGGSHWQGSGIF